MRNILLVLIVCLVSVSSILVAQTGQLQITHDKQAKAKAKADKDVVRDKRKPVRRALESQYAKLAAAIRNKDFEGFQSVRTADFSTRDVTGQPQTSAQMAALARTMLANLQPPIEVSFVIDTIDVRENEAVATIHQRFSRMQNVGGALRKVETSVTQEETWVQTTDGWKLKFVENVRDLVWLVDGKRVEPGKPYDPNAPAYNPDAARKP